MNKELFAVAGNPIIHSKSPIIFNSIFKKENYDGRYTRILCESSREIIELQKILNIKGLNITSPFKKSILPYLDKISPIAKKIGSVNTILQKNNELIGFNTDVIGVQNSFRYYNIPVKKKQILIIGAGGAGKAAAFAVKEMGGSVSIVNRTFAKAQEIANLLEIDVYRIENLPELVQNSDIIISCLLPNVDIIQKKWLSKDTIIFDANYKSSSLIEKAETIGCQIIKGIDWLIFQAIPAIKMFTGLEANYNQVEKYLAENQLKNKDIISLIGFMGTGKSSISRLLSEKLKMSLVSLDYLIAKNEGISISEIFKNRGEKYFRTLESKFLSENIERDNFIDCGGGIVLKKENLLLLQKALNVWLVSKNETSINRIKQSSRPLLKKDNPEKIAQELFKYRIPYYAEIADLIFFNEGKNIAEISESLYAEIH